jgi:hypothetical protein
MGVCYAMAATPRGSEPIGASLEQRRRLAHAVALSVVHSHDSELLDDGVILGVFGDGFDTHDVPDAINGFRHGLVDRVAFQVLDEPAVDLEPARPA